MIDKAKLRKLADIIVNYSLELKKNEKVLLIGYGFDSYPLIKEIYAECVRKGALKIETRFPNAELNRLFYEHANVKQLTYLSDLEKTIADDYDCMAQIVAEENPYELGQIDDKKRILAQKARKPVSDILHRKKWLLFYYPNTASAQTAKRSLEEWEDFVLDSCLQDWKKENQKQQKFISLLKKVKIVRIKGSETDLELSVAGQKWRDCCGKRNLPDGEVFTSPILNSVNGVIRYNVPTIYNSQDFNWVKLTLKEGKVVQEESDNQGELSKILNTDAGARFFGEFAFGLNNSVTTATRQIIFDEKMGKSLHMALGKCYEECPNGNDSNIHWDLIFNFIWAKAELFFDNQKVFSDGQWTDPRFRFLN